MMSTDPSRAVYSYVSPNSAGELCGPFCVACMNSIHNRKPSVFYSNVDEEDVLPIYLLTKSGGKRFAINDLCYKNGSSTPFSFSSLPKGIDLALQTCCSTDCKQSPAVLHPQLTCNKSTFTSLPELVNKSTATSQPELLSQHVQCESCSHANVSAQTVSLTPDKVVAIQAEPTSGKSLIERGDQTDDDNASRVTDQSTNRIWLRIQLELVFYVIGVVLWLFHGMWRMFSNIWTSTRRNSISEPVIELADQEASRSSKNEMEVPSSDDSCLESCLDPRLDDLGCDSDYEEEEEDLDGESYLACPSVTVPVFPESPRVHQRLNTSSFYVFPLMPLLGFGEPRRAERNESIFEEDQIRTLWSSFKRRSFDRDCYLANHPQILSFRKNCPDRCSLCSVHVDCVCEMLDHFLSDRHRDSLIKGSAVRVVDLLKWTDIMDTLMSLKTRSNVLFNFSAAVNRIASSLKKPKKAWPRFGVYPEECYHSYSSLANLFEKGLLVPVFYLLVSLFLVFVSSASISQKLSYFFLFYLSAVQMGHRFSKSVFIYVYDVINYLSDDGLTNLMCI